MARRIKAFTLSVLTWSVCAALALSFGARAEAGAEGDAEPAGVKAMFLNVGKADAALFFLGDKRYLIDTGSKDSADAMLRALSYFGVDKLDGVMITHTDKDHVGGLKALMKSEIEVGTLYAPAFSTLADGDHPVVKLAEKNGLALRRLYAGDVIEAGEGMRFVVLGPITKDETEENNDSLVLRLETPEGDMLLTGDMLLEEEGDLLAAGVVGTAAVLKVGHHGAEDAGGEAFLYTVRPQIAVISTDPAEDDDTPSPKVIKRLWDVGADVFTTYRASCCVLVTLSGGNAVGQLVNYLVD
jgi:competence protein ComEC